jgi:predicted signal transduction protein with EAL and GGDEF domain
MFLSSAINAVITNRKLASIGSSIGVINDSLDLQSLFDRADEAMYADKKARKAGRQ